MAAESDQTERGPSWRMAILVLVTGGVGGLLSWVYATTVGEAPKSPPSLALPSWMALGCGAAFIGVFLFAVTDTRARIRCLAFALACGFAWKPVYEASTALIEKQSEQMKVDELTGLIEQTNEAVAGIQEAGPQQVAAKAREVESLSREVLRVAGDVKDRRAYDSAVFAVADAVRGLGEAEAMRVPETVVALEGIAETAWKVGELPIASRATDTLSEVERAPGPPVVKREAARAFKAMRSRLDLLDRRRDMRAVRPTPPVERPK